jgi:hypothetical protein
MEADLKKMKIEDDLIFFGKTKMKTSTKNERQPQKNGRQPPKKLKNGRLIN